MNYTQQIFKMLNIEPYEEFKIRDNELNLKLNQTLRFTNNFIRECYYENTKSWEECDDESILQCILNGTYKIIKIPKLTPEDKIAIDYKDESFKDEVGGIHDCGIGWNPNGVWCGECCKFSCKGCSNEFATDDK